MSFFKKNDDGFVEILKEVQETIQGEVLDEETETYDFEKARADKLRAFSEWARKQEI